MKIDIQKFKEYYVMAQEYRNGIFVPEDIMLLINESMLLGKTECDIPDDTCEVIEINRRKQELHDKHYTDVSVLRLAGMNAEAIDDIDEAIAQYAEAIRIGEASEFDLLHAYRHAYDRIIILLSRTHAYAREAEYIEQLLKWHKLQDSDRTRLEERLRKTYMKINK